MLMLDTGRPKDGVLLGTRDEMVSRGCRCEGSGPSSRETECSSEPGCVGVHLWRTNAEVFLIFIFILRFRTWTVKMLFYIARHARSSSYCDGFHLGAILFSDHAYQL